MLTVSGDSDAIVWGTVEGHEILHLVNAGLGVHLLSCSWSPRGAAIIIPRGTKAMAEWNPTSGAMLREFDAGGYVMSCTYSRDGLKIAASVRGGPSHVRVWSAPSGALLHQLGPPCLTCLAHPLAFSGDAQYLVSATGDGCGALRLWNLETGALQRDLGCCGHALEITDAAYAPDGTALLTASRDGTAKVVVKIIEQVRSIDRRACVPLSVPLAEGGGSWPWVLPPRSPLQAQRKLPSYPPR